MEEGSGTPTGIQSLSRRGKQADRGKWKHGSGNMELYSKREKRMGKISKEEVDLVLATVLGKGLVFDESILDELHYKTVDGNIELSVNDFVGKCIDWAYKTKKLYVTVGRNPEHDIDFHCDHYVADVCKIGKAKHTGEQRVIRLAFIGGDSKFHAVIRTIVWIINSENLL